MHATPHRPIGWAKRSAAGVIGAAVVTLAVVSYEAGWQTSRRQLAESMVAAEATTWPVASMFFELFELGPSREERNVWGTMLANYARAPRGREYALAIGSVADWNVPHRETRAGLYQWLVLGWPNEPGILQAAPAVQDFFMRNAHPALVRCALPAGSKFVSRSAMRAYSGRFAWEQFSGAFGVDAYVSMSRVGFNVLRNRAVVYVSVWCGGMCGHGTYYVLQKRHGRWVVVAEYLHWIA